MSENSGMTSGMYARITGVLGLLMLVSGSFAGFSASKLLVHGNFIATAQNIVASPGLFRLGILGSLVMIVAWVFYALLLYRLLRSVSRQYAMTMLALVIASAPIYLLNQVNLYALLPLASSQQYGQVSLYLDTYRFGNEIAAIFFGLWLFPLGFLVFRSGFLPKTLGVLLMAGTLGYLVLFVQGFFFPQLPRTLWSNPLLVLTHVSELALLLWLLVMGVDEVRWKQRDL